MTKSADAIVPVRLFTDNRVIAAIYALMTLIATWHKVGHGHANNLRIFRSSFFNLVAGADLYALHPEQHLDYFKYSPTFALLMAPLAVLPEFVSAMAWNFCNVFALFTAIQLLNLAPRQRALVLWLILIELLTSIQNFQSNGLVTAFIIATFIALERRQPEVAGIFVALGASIKIFGGAGALFALFHPRKLRFVFAMIVSAVLLFALPLLVTSPSQLLWQYRNWSVLLRADYYAPEKLSIMSWLRAWFGFDLPNSIVQIAGGCLLLLPLSRAFLKSPRHLPEPAQADAGRSTVLANEKFRLIFLGSLLVFLVIFNHKAESPMFILAVTGVAIWYVAGGQSGVRNFVVALVLAVTSLGSTDLVPHYWRVTVTTPLVLKTVPCILAWFVMQVELLRFSSSPMKCNGERESRGKVGS